MKMLVVDDEKILRHGIIYSFAWADLGIRQIFEARNGKEALTVFTEKRPDIVVTDIRMPLMDGIELSYAIRALAPHVQIIFITGFSDLDYMRAALKTEALDYILKPVDTEELWLAVSKAAGRCSEREKETHSRQEMELKLRESAPLFIRQMMRDILGPGPVLEEQIREKLTFYGIPFSLDESYTAAVLYYRERVAEQMQDDICVFGTESILKEVIETEFPCYVIARADRFICLIQADATEKERILALLEEAREKLLLHLALESYIVVGPFVEGLLHIRESYEYAAQVSRLRLAELPAKAVFYDVIPAAQGSFQMDKAQLSILHRQFYESPHKAEKQLLAWLTETAPQMPDLEHLRSCCIFLAGDMIGGVCPEQISREDIDFYVRCMSDLRLCYTTADVTGVMQRFLRDYRQFRSENDRTGPVRIVHEIKQILAEHVGRDLTIRDLSQMVFLTPTYICALFKKETGVTVNDYYTGLKIEKAKVLLLAGTSKVYEVSLAVGYQDVKYFSRIFKRQTGLTPSDYAVQKRGSV